MVLYTLLKVYDSMGKLMYIGRYLAINQYSNTFVSETLTV